MATRIRFKNIFKRMVLEESPSGSVARAQISRRYNIFPQLFIRRCKDCTAGKSARDNDSGFLARGARIRELKRMVDKLALENQLNRRLAGRRFIH